MNNKSTNLTSGSNSITSEKLIHLEGGAFYVDLPNVITKNKLVFVQNIYTLLRYDCNNDAEVRTVKFWHAAHKGSFINLIVLDLNSGEILKPTQRI